MTLKVAAALALLLCVGGFGIAATINQFAIVDAVNEKLPKDEQFERLGWYLTKTLRLHGEYRRFYPVGGLLWRQGVLETIMLVCLVLAASFIGFGLLGIAWVGGGGALLLWFMYFRKSSPS
jgi:hypothetical protein